MRCFLVLIITDERSLAIWTWLCLVRRLFYRYFVYRKLKRVVNNHTDSKEILFTWCYRKPLIEKIKAKRWIDVFNWILIAVFVSQFFFSAWLAKSISFDHIIMVLIILSDYLLPHFVNDGKLGVMVRGFSAGFCLDYYYFMIVCLLKCVKYQRRN